MCGQGHHITAQVMAAARRAVTSLSSFPVTSTDVNGKRSAVVFYAGFKEGTRAHPSLVSLRSLVNPSRGRSV